MTTKKWLLKSSSGTYISKKLRTAKEGICNSFFTVPSQSYANLRVWNNNSIDGSLTSSKQFYCTYEYIKGKI